MLSATPDMLAAIGGHINREYGCHGYHVNALENDSWVSVVATVRHSDGSEFRIRCDRWENLTRLPDEPVIPSPAEAKDGR